jgi:pimeloyl-ACP methyl ester carboxylesterase
MGLRWIDTKAMHVRESRIDIPANKTLPAASIVYYEYGTQDDAKPVLLCVHGLARNGHDFDVIGTALCDQYRVISVDMPGRGKSPWLSDSMQYIYPNYVGWMLAFIKALGIKKVNWLGTSMGGIIGMIIAGTLPHRIERLIVNDVGAMVPKEGLKRISDYLDSIVLRDSKQELEDYLKRIYSSFGIDDETLWQHLFEHSIRQTEDGKYSLAFDPAIIDPIRKDTKNFTEFKDADLWQFWNNIKCPVLVIRGQLSDILLPTTAQQMQNSPIAPTLYEVENVGHAPALMNVEQISYVKKWLISVPAFKASLKSRFFFWLSGF